MFLYPYNLSLGTKTLLYFLRHGEDIKTGIKCSKNPNGVLSIGFPSSSMSSNIRINFSAPTSLVVPTSSIEGIIFHRRVSLVVCGFIHGP